MNAIKTPLGLVLLFFGIAVILYSLYSSYAIFSAKTSPPEIFKVEAKTITQKAGAQDLQSQLQGVLEQQLQGILPAGSLPALLNLAAWSIFAGILIFGGAQISGLGIKLLK